MQAVRLASGALLIRDDFKSNRESLQAALQVLRDYPATRKILVLGGVAEIPSREQYQYFRQLGREIAASVDHAVLFLRKNSFRRCRNQALEAGMDPGSLVRAEEDPLSALPHIPSPLGEGDLILVKGRNEYRTARLSLALAGNRVTCRLASCRVPVDCDDCELLAGDDRENPLLAPNLNKTK